MYLVSVVKTSHYFQLFKCILFKCDTSVCIVICLQVDNIEPVLFNNKTTGAVTALR